MWLIEKAFGCLMFYNAAMVQKDDFARESTRLPDIVGHDDDFNASPLRIDQQLLNGERRSWIETRGRLIE